MVRAQRAAALYACATAFVAAAPDGPQLNDFDWTSITPTPELVYHECYNGTYQCARLQVPLDWQHPENNKTAALAVINWPATVPADDSRHGGTVFTNPGGPGGSGVGLVLRRGKQIRTILDSDDRRYDILSWDPRAVGFTTPHAECFGADEDARLSRDALAIEKRGLGQLGTSYESLKRNYALDGAYGVVCNATLADSEILRHSTTPAVARDIVGMLDRIAELKKKEAKTLGKRSFLGPDGQHRLIVGDDQTAEDHSPPRLQYWGFSYGTILGNTFASMFPGRVGRVIVDGVADAYDYMAGTWLLNLQDTEKVHDYFYESCFEAGERCALKKPSDKSAEDIRSRVAAFIAKADESPIPFANGHQVAAITGDDVRHLLVTPIYQPLELFAGLAKTLAETLAGNYTGLLQAQEIPLIKSYCSLANDTAKAVLGDGTYAIACGDAADATQHDVQYYDGFIKTLRNQSDTFGARWARLHLLCHSKRWNSAWQFTGPFTTPPADPSIREGIPAAPLLFLSSELDPVTPLRNAYHMSEGHPGSSVVYVKGAGHCSLSPGWSPGLQKIVQTFFRDGVVPKKGTMVESECKPFQEGHCGPATFEVSSADRDTWHAPRFQQYFPPAL